MRPAGGEAASAPERAPIFSARLQALLEDILRAQAPNAGRFCGNCYNPLADDADQCAHCGLSTAQRPPVRQIPPEVFAMVRAQRLREAIPVRSLAWGGLAAGLSLALFLMVVLPFWWNVGASIVVFGITYVAAANIANSLGDALGYRWGQRVLEKGLAAGVFSGEDQAKAQRTLDTAKRRGRDTTPLWAAIESDLDRLAALPNVCAKISGLVTEADWRHWSVEDLHRYINAALDSFGPARLMIGSDWPVCTVAASYGAVLDVVRTAVTGLSQDARAAVLGGTARRFWNLPDVCSLERSI